MADLLGRAPDNLRVAVGLGDVAAIARAGGQQRDFYRPHSGFPEWTPSYDP